jgi:hypothetical protein
MTMDAVELQARLDAIRAWRKIELSHARSVAERHQSSAELPYLCRAWTMMIYAHCDQALKLIAREYLNFRRDVPRKDYDYRTVWLSFFGKEAIRHPSDSRFLLCSFDDQNSYKTMLQNILSGTEVFGSANFSYQILRFYMDWVIQTPFAHIEYRAFCTTLKEKRDGIAHGEQISIRNVQDCLAWHEPAVALLDGIVDATLEAALGH